MRIQSEKQHRVSSSQDSQCNVCLQQLSLLRQSAASGSANTLFLCFLQAASQPERSGSWGLTWSPFGKGTWEPQEPSALQMEPRASVL